MIDTRPWKTAVRRRFSRTVGALVLLKNMLYGLRALWWQDVSPKDLSTLKGDLFRQYRPMPLRQPASPPQSQHDLSVIIPVFNNADLFRLVVLDLTAAIRASQGLARVEIIVVDDESASDQVDEIASVCSEYSLELLTNPTNLGYLRSVNRAAQAANFNLLLVLNTDIRFPPDTIDRALAVLDASGATLVTVPEFERLANLGLRADSWVHADRMLASSPAWMPACTAEGYFLFWARRDSSDVPFDESLGHGYGEDTDLHYRVVTSGRRSVLALNACVLHSGSASYALHGDQGGIRDKAWEHFRYHWGELHDLHWPAHALNIQRHLTVLSDRGGRSPIESDYLFVVPRMSESVGGLAVAATAAKSLSATGAKVSIVTLQDGSDSIVIGGALRLIPVTDVASAKRDAPLTVLFGDTLPAFVEKAASASRTDMIYVLQGPDWYMNPLSLKGLKQIGALATLTLANSDYMVDQASVIGARRVERFAIPTPPVSATLNDREDRPYKVAAVIREDHGKAPWASAAVLNHFALRGDEVAAIVPNASTRNFVETHLLEGTVTVTECRSPREVSSVLTDTRVLVDLSLYEGWGMVPREALAVGTKVVTLSNGGSDEFRDDPRAVFISGICDFAEILSAVELLAQPGGTEQKDTAREPTSHPSLSDALSAQLTRSTSS